MKKKKEYELTEKGRLFFAIFFRLKEKASKFDPETFREIILSGDDKDLTTLLLGYGIEEFMDAITNLEGLREESCE